jgi:hypothetical protein
MTDVIEDDPAEKVEEFEDFEDTGRSFPYSVVDALPSHKPITKTLIDATIIATITVLVITFLSFLYYLLWAQDLSEMMTFDFLWGTGKSFAFAFGLQLAYEYVGFNAMLAESSMRYAKKGSTPQQKWQSRQHATLAKLVYNSGLDRNSENVQKMVNVVEYGLNVVPKLKSYIKKKTEKGEPVDLQKFTTKVRKQLGLFERDKDGRPLFNTKVVEQLAQLDADEPSAAWNPDAPGKEEGHEDPRGNKNYNLLRAIPNLVETLSVNPDLTVAIMEQGFKAEWLRPITLLAGKRLHVNWPASFDSEHAYRMYLKTEGKPKKPKEVGAIARALRFVGLR